MRREDTNMPWTDNVKIKEDFVAKHPWWDIKFNTERRQFEAQNTREENFTITDPDLGRLLGKLMDIEGIGKKSADATPYA